MNKAELIIEAQKILGDGTSKTDIVRTLDAILEAIRTSISKHETVQLVGFGSFSVVRRAARVSLNPRTKEKLNVPEKSVVKFKPGTELSQAV